MTPAYDFNGVQIHHGDALAVLNTMPSESVHTCVTSPPYWGLRDYGVEAQVWGGDPEHEHEWGDTISVNSTNHTDKRRWQHTRNGRDEEQPTEKRVAWLRTPVPQGKFCECGAWAGSLGLEPAPELFVAHIVEIFEEVRRVLKDDGTLWLNMGDCYATGAGKVGDCPGGGEQGAKWKGNRGANPTNSKRGIGIGPTNQPNRMPIVGLKSKDLVGIPWMCAFALRAAGWYLRQEIIWSKPAPMPESVQDRCTKSHESLFLLAKSERYYFDNAAIAEPAKHWTGQAAIFDRTGPVSQHVLPGQSAAQHRQRAPNSHKGSGFDTGKTGDHQLGRASKRPRTGGKHSVKDEQSPGRRMVESVQAARDAGGEHETMFGETRNKRSVWTVNTHPYAEAHFATFPPALITPCIYAGCPIGGTVLDPFGGSGTTGMVAKELGRKAILIELSQEYICIAQRRLQQGSLFSEDT